MLDTALAQKYFRAGNVMLLTIFTRNQSLTKGVLGYYMNITSNNTHIYYYVCLQTIIKIIESGGDPEYRDNLGNTPLHTLIKAKFSNDIVKLDCIVTLLAYGGCDPDIRTTDGKTALHLAVEVCALLLVSLYLSP